MTDTDKWIGRYFKSIAWYFFAFMLPLKLYVDVDDGVFGRSYWWSVAAVAVFGWASFSAYVNCKPQPAVMTGRTPDWNKNAVLFEFFWRLAQAVILLIPAVSAVLILRGAPW